MTVKNSDVLTAARRLISDPKNWTTGELARDQDGKVVRPDSPFACSWCALGARDRAAKVFEGALKYHFYGALDLAAAKVNPSVENNSNLRPIAALNDKFGGHAEVLRAYDIAIEAEKARELAEEIDRMGKDDA